MILKINRILNRLMKVTILLIILISPAIRRNKTSTLIFLMKKIVNGMEKIWPKVCLTSLVTFPQPNLQNCGKARKQSKLRSPSCDLDLAWGSTKSMMGLSQLESAVVKGKISSINAVSLRKPQEIRVHYWDLQRDQMWGWKNLSTDWPWPDIINIMIN